MHGHAQNPVVSEWMEGGKGQGDWNPVAPNCTQWYPMVPTFSNCEQEHQKMQMNSELMGTLNADWFKWKVI